MLENLRFAVLNNFIDIFLINVNGLCFYLQFCAISVNIIKKNNVIGLLFFPQV